MGNIKPVLSNDKKTVTFGLYPQTLVTDANLLKRLDSHETTKSSNGYYTLNGEYFVKINAHPYDKRYVFNDLTKIYDGDAYWFKCEPIQWSIIHCYRDVYLLRCRHIIDLHRYHDSVKETRLGLFKKAIPGDYMYSELRSWLNNEFVRKAFLSDTSALLSASDIKDCMSEAYSHFSELDSDKVFLLPSYVYSKCAHLNEFTGYRFSYIGHLSDYVLARGADLESFYWSTDDALLSGLECARVYSITSSNEYSRKVTDERVGVIPIIAVKL